jgi:hypothetical protein
MPMIARAAAVAALFALYAYCVMAIVSGLERRPRQTCQSTAHCTLREKISAEGANFRIIPANRN